MAAIICLSLTIPGCSSEGQDRLLVFAAASMENAFTEVVDVFEETGDAAVDVSYGGSQTLASQIVSGAPADVFISAGHFPVEFLREHKQVGDKTINLLTNELVVVVSNSNGLALTNLEGLKNPEIERIALADPELAPAGQYAREALVAVNVWDDIQPKLVLGPDVRVTLAYVEAKNADVALVYATDAATAAGVRILNIVPSGAHSTILYPAVVMPDSENIEQAYGFVKFLQGPTAQRIFREYGFVPVDEAP